MDIKIKIGPNYPHFVAAMKKLPGEIGDALEEGVDDGALHIEREIKLSLDAGRDGLHTRTGTLKRTISSYDDTANRFFNFVGPGNAFCICHAKITGYLRRRCLVVSSPVSRRSTYL